MISGGGVESGDDPYMFGMVVAAWDTGQRVYLADMQTPAVRVYDRDGRHLFDVGAPGQGPGEYQRPTALAVQPDGRVFVADLGAGRINVYAGDGSPLDSWELGSPQAGAGLVLTADGTLHTMVIELPSDPTRLMDLSSLRQGMQEVGPD